MTTKSPRRRGPAKGTPRATRMTRAEREAQLLSIAEEMLIERGDKDTTVEEIAERAGITKPVIYDHFTSKDDLIARVMERAHDEFEATILEACAAMEDPGDAYEYVSTFVHTWFDYIESRHEIFNLLRQDRGLSVMMLAKIRHKQAALVVEALRNTRDFADTPENALVPKALCINGLLERFAIWRVEHPEITAEEAADTVLDTVWHGVQPPKA